MVQLAIIMTSFQDLEIAKTCFESASPCIFALIQPAKHGFLLRFFKILNCYENFKMLVM
ncbi:type I site-specific restriction-modification system, R subunit and related helicases [Candidatus Brocadia sinica JPN1]|uniref:Type I site-specific restriction-modification system, R subunit and related helicases n=1 Tax=Candidatus Brocadia sinica JPN1 TaxID=1197129 RepID=A0ABQ0K361_9BACT|nr:type I site-specific restriction-modification system, R subunit and related helicases [Candidatus Brocadia sinica JPN1]